MGEPSPVDTKMETSIPTHTNTQIGGNEAAGPTSTASDRAKELQDSDLKEEDKMDIG